VRKQFALELLVALGLGGSVWGQPPLKPGFEGILRSLSSAPADACEGNDFSKLEYLLFMQADDAVTQALNQGPGGTAPDRARQTLQNLEQRLLPAPKDSVSRALASRVRSLNSAKTALTGSKSRRPEMAGSSFPSTWNDYAIFAPHSSGLTSRACREKSQW